VQSWSRACRTAVRTRIPRPAAISSKAGPRWRARQDTSSSGSAITQHELGLIDSRYAPHSSENGPGGAVCWHVDDGPATLEKQLSSMGAKEHEPLANCEAGFVTASAVDPFGNILGIRYNPHYLETLATKSQ
jgi:hypothetical protein